MPGEPPVDLDRDNAMVEAMEIPMSMANCCSTGVEMTDGTFFGAIRLPRTAVSCLQSM